MIKFSSNAMAGMYFHCRADYGYATRLDQRFCGFDIRTHFRRRNTFLIQL